MKAIFLIAIILLGFTLLLIMIKKKQDIEDDFEDKMPLSKKIIPHYGKNMGGKETNSESEEETAKKILEDVAKHKF